MKDHRVRQHVFLCYDERVLLCLLLCPLVHQLAGELAGMLVYELACGIFYAL